MNVMDATLFWTAFQGISTAIAAVAAIIALVIAGKQLGGLSRSNRLLAESNDAMAESNVALTRPYVSVDFEFSPMVSRTGQVRGTNVFVVIRNDGRTAAHDVRLSADRPFAPLSEPDTEGWVKSVSDLNDVASGKRVLQSLTNTRPLKYYLDGEELFGKGDEPAPVWAVAVEYRDSNGRVYHDAFTLEVEPWRRSLVIADPLVRIGKYIDAVAHETKALNSTVKSKKFEASVAAPDSDVKTHHGRRRRRFRGF